ncbi:hypothetical protein BDV95DRAFT_4636 [Massariosphaeria phaeospora]|uniref:Uncharacterized protein n=1 Tax=Massariosphaeria phaeospora TaxID=100035 RepID=A0A7C8MDK5_9PLEO|nr:hypothetical protein BDV95DRAFT_4636 [Massariosphaeria phaeospora]
MYPACSVLKPVEAYLATSRMRGAGERLGNKRPWWCQQMDWLSLSETDVLQYQDDQSVGRPPAQHGEDAERLCLLLTDPACIVHLSREAAAQPGRYEAVPAVSAAQSTRRIHTLGEKRQAFSRRCYWYAAGILRLLTCSSSEWAMAAVSR